MLVHEGAADRLRQPTDPSTPFGRIVNGVTAEVDAIVSGHTHLAYNLVDRGDTARSISSGQYGERFSDMEIVGTTPTPRPSSRWSTPRTRVYSGAGTTPAAYVANYAQEPGIAAVVAESVASAKVAGSVKVGDITASFQRGLQPRTPTAEDPATTQEARGGESTLGNFVADVQLWPTQVPDPATPRSRS